MPELVFGWAVLKKPPSGFSASTVVAGCGVLKPLNRLEFGALELFCIAASEGFSVLLDAASCFCDVPKMLNPDVEPLGEAVVVPFGFASDVNKLGLGVSAAEMLLESAGLRLLKRLFEMPEVFSCP